MRDTAECLQSCSMLCTPLTHSKLRTLHTVVRGLCCTPQLTRAFGDTGGRPAALVCCVKCPSLGRCTTQCCNLHVQTSALVSRVYHRKDGQLRSAPARTAPWGHSLSDQTVSWRQWMLHPSPKGWRWTTRKYGRRRRCLSCVQRWSRCVKDSVWTRVSPDAPAVAPHAGLPLLGGAAVHRAQRAQSGAQVRRRLHWLLTHRWRHLAQARVALHRREVPVGCARTRACSCTVADASAAAGTRAALPTGPGAGPTLTTPTPMLGPRTSRSCVIVRDGRIIAKGFNLTNELRNVSGLRATGVPGHAHAAVRHAPHISSGSGLHERRRTPRLMRVRALAFRTPNTGAGAAAAPLSALIPSPIPVAPRRRGTPSSRPSTRCCSRRAEILLRPSSGAASCTSPASPASCAPARCR